MTVMKTHEEKTIRPRSKQSKYDQVVYIVLFSPDEKSLPSDERHILDSGDAGNRPAKYVYVNSNDFEGDRLKNPDNAKFEPLKHLTRKSKVKIFGHCSAGSDFLQSGPAYNSNKLWKRFLTWLNKHFNWPNNPSSLNDRQNFNVEKVAAVVQLINPREAMGEMKSLPEQKSTSSAPPQELLDKNHLKISLIACQGGTPKLFPDGKIASSSFAQKLADKIFTGERPVFCSISAAKNTIEVDKEDGHRSYIDEDEAPVERSQPSSNPLLRTLKAGFFTVLDTLYQGCANLITNIRQYHQHSETYEVPPNNEHLSNKQHKAVFVPASNGSNIITKETTSGPCTKFTSTTSTQFAPIMSSAGKAAFASRVGQPEAFGLLDTDFSATFKYSSCLSSDHSETGEKTEECEFIRNYS